MPELFDLKLRALRRDRAFHSGPELFLLERAFGDCLERIGLVRGGFGSALLIGCPDPAWSARLGQIAGSVDVLEPGPRFARAAGTIATEEERWTAPQAAYGLCVSVGTLDTVNDLQLALGKVRSALRPGALFIGALSGGDTLPQLRSALRTADSIAGEAVPHVHPRIEASALAPLLSGAGFANPVVDVDRVQVSYRSLDRLVSDLRAMAATNVLCARSRTPLSRAAAAAAADAFSRAADGERTVETFEILHFAAWTPPVP